MSTESLAALLYSRSPIPRPDAVDHAAFARQPLPPDAVRALTCMADIESHTIIYLRELLATRAVEDPAVAAFLACWLYEESAHGQALAAVLTASGHPPQPRPRRARTWRARVEAAGIAALSGVWPDFLALHMTWGALNELTALAAYRRLAARAAHPPLDALLAAIARDEARHFRFYRDQAARRLAASPAARRVTRALMERFWAPVGHDVQPPEITQAVATYLFEGHDGRRAARRIDASLRRLPGFADAALVERWLDRHGIAA